MLHSVCGEHTCNTGIKAASEESSDSSLFELLTVCPLPLVLEFCSIKGFVVCCINVVSFCSETSVHDSEILIGECKIEHNIGLVALDKSNKLINVVSIHLSSFDNSLCCRLELFFKGIAFGFCTACDHNSLENLAVLTALVDCYGSYSSAADNHTFFHFIFLLKFNIVLLIIISFFVC